MGVSCSEGVDCAGICDGGAAVDECGICGGLGYNEGGCCDEEGADCLSYAEIQTIFDTSYPSSTKCTLCHGGGGGLDLTSYVNLMSGGNNGSVVIPFDSENSNLVMKLNPSPTFGVQMPKDGPAYLDPALIVQIATWIDQGALENP